MLKNKKKIIQVKIIGNFIILYLVESKYYILKCATEYEADVFCTRVAFCRIRVFAEKESNCDPSTMACSAILSPLRINSANPDAVPTMEAWFLSGGNTRKMNTVTSREMYLLLCKASMEETIISME